MTQQSNRFNQKIGGFVLSYLSQFVYLLSSLFFLPFILKILGQNEYGLYQFSASIISNLSLLSLGLNSAYIKFYSKFKSQNDEQSLKKLNGLYLHIFIFIAFISLVCSFIIIENLDMFFNDKLTSSELNKSKKLMLILAFCLSMSFVNNVFQAIVLSKERFVWSKVMELLSVLLNPSISFPLLLLGYQSYSLAIASCVATLIVFIFNFFYIIFKLNTKFIFFSFDLKLLKELLIFSFFIFLNIIVEQISWNIDNILLAKFCGVTEVAIYSIGGQIVHIFRVLNGSIRTLFIPEFNKLVSESQNINVIENKFIDVSRKIYFVCIFMFGGYCLFGEQIIIYWIGEKYKLSYYCALILLASLVVPIIQGPGIDIQRAMNKHMARSVAYTVIAMANVLISIILIYHIGILGAPLGTAIALISGHWIFMNYYYNYHLSINIKKYWFSIINTVPLLLMYNFVFYLLIYYFKTKSILGLIVEICIYSILYFAIVFFFCLNKTEKDLFFRLFCKKIFKNDFSINDNQV